MGRKPRRASRPDDVLSLLGLARRAGEAISGIAASREALRQNRVHLLLIAEDAAEGQVSKLRGIMEGRKVPFRIVGDRKGLGAAIGESPRSAVAVTSASFADQLLKRIPGPSGHGSMREHRR